MFRASINLHRARGIAFLVACVVVGGGTAAAAFRVNTSFHDPKLAAAAVGMVSVLSALFAVVAAAVSFVGAKWMGARSGRLTTTGTAMLLIVAIVVGALLAVWVLVPRLFEVLDPLRVFWGPGMVLAYLCVAGLHAWRRSAVNSIRRTRIWAGFLFVLGFGAMFHSAFGYGESNRVRALVEQKSITGGTLVRTYTKASDWDGDGYGSIFGGGDCNDGDPKINPGATDIAGDGVDSDCFGGDSQVDVSDLSDGRYGELPEELRSLTAGEGITPKKPNVLLVMVDALRPDRLGTFGNKRPTSPRIDAFAKGAVVFEQAIAQSPRSIRSIPALMTGRYPSQIAYGDEYLYPSLNKENECLAEILRKGGYTTGVAIGTNYFRRVDGFFQGFGQVRQGEQSRSPRDEVATRTIQMIDAALAVPEESRKPWFMWAHIFNVHEPYLKGGPLSMFGNDSLDKYDTEIRLADTQFGRLLDALKNRNLEDNTIVILASDHGEAFGEHGTFGHSRSLYEEETRSVLMIRSPGIYPKRMPDPVALMDVGPTIANFAGVKFSEPIPARSLLPIMTKEAEPDRKRLIFSEVFPDGMFPFDQKAVRQGDSKLIWWQREGMFQLYDLRSDPGEKNDFSDDDRNRSRELLGFLRAWVSQTHRKSNIQDAAIAENRLAKLPVKFTDTVDARFDGLFTLVGVDIKKRDFKTGDRISMDFYFRVDEETRKNLVLYVDLVGPGGYRFHDFHARHYPLNGRYRTFDWKRGELLHDPVRIVVPHDVRHPITMKIRFSVRHKNKPLPFSPNADGAKFVDLGEIKIR